ncbi:hypothetical protein [Nonomuraea ceibae]|uniref:hypothetical protein n=1 Tax=Nonomuraea ceibae TaxID=1935170 RepID=UPI001FE6372D|nr:hypothetical protein [Nonomuraea ceibae]
MRPLLHAFTGCALLAGVLTITQAPTEAAGVRLVNEDPAQPVELLGAATETMRATRHPDGRITMETWSQPVRVKQQATGAWAWIDTTLTERDGALQPKVAKTGAAFSPGGADLPAVTFSANEKQSISLSWPTPLPRPTVAGNKATYADAAGPGADLVLTALPTGYRQEIVLRAKPVKPLDVRLPVKANGLKFRTREDGRVELADASGHRVTRPLWREPFRPARQGKIRAGQGRQGRSVPGHPGR